MRGFRGILGKEMDADLAAALARIESRLTSIESRMDRLESKMDAGFASLNSRVGMLESTVALDMSLIALRNVTLTNFDGVYKRLDRIDSEYHSLSAAVRRIEERPN